MAEGGELRVIQITSTHSDVEVAERLDADGASPLGRCSIEGTAPHHFLVSDASRAEWSLRRHGIGAVEVDPPLSVDAPGIRWWKSWRDALPPETYLAFRSLHHDAVRSHGSLIRVRADRSLRSEPWRVLADANVDVRCESHCNLPTGGEVHMLVPDPDVATTALRRAGVSACTMDYAGPRIEQGISWWGEWRPALAYAGQAGRLILLSFASPRVEQVPGVW